MKFLVGLGNPGERYHLNRHNAGFLVLCCLAEQNHISIGQTLFDSRIGKGVIAGSPVLLALPQTFMNLSGEAVRRLVDYFRIDIQEMIIVHDDLDLPFQTLRLKAGGGHGGHKGLMSIIERLGGPGFSRVRLGIGRPDHKSMVESYVLSPFTKEESITLPHLLIAAGEAVTDIISSGIHAAIEKHHGKAHSTLIKED